MKGDFHIHSNYSDGQYSIDEIIKLAKHTGLSVISITDHDILDGSKKAKQSYEDEDLKIIVGLELSTDYNGESIHILGYFSDLSSCDAIERHLEVQRLTRLERAHSMKKKLKDYYRIDLNMDFTKDIDSITRGTIASQIITQGYPYTKKEIFDRMIGDNCPAYLPSTKLLTQMGIKLIHESQGLAVLAHPVLLKKARLKDIIEMGIDGIEAIYPVNTNEDTKRLMKIARNNNLLITAGSDFHSMNDHLHGNIGDIYLEDEYLDRFLNRLMEVK